MRSEQPVPISSTARLRRGPRVRMTAPRIRPGPWRTALIQLTVDAALLSRLHNLDGLIEFRDEEGRTLGYFHPLVRTGGAGGPPVRSPISDEEIQRRRQQRTGRPLSEILAGLGQS